MLIFELANMHNYGGNLAEAWRLVPIQLAGVALSTLIHHNALLPSRNQGLAARTVIAIGASAIVVVVYVFVIWAVWFVLAPVPAYADGVLINTGWDYLTQAAPRLVFLNFPIFFGW